MHKLSEEKEFGRKPLDEEEDTSKALNRREFLKNVGSGVALVTGGYVVVSLMEPGEAAGGRGCTGQCKAGDISGCKKCTACTQSCIRENINKPCSKQCIACTVTGTCTFAKES